MSLDDGVGVSLRRCEPRFRTVLHHQGRTQADQGSDWRLCRPSRRKAAGEISLEQHAWRKAPTFTLLLAKLARRARLNQATHARRTTPNTLQAKRHLVLLVEDDADVRERLCCAI